ncbi:MAG: phosphoribosylanthranilate isomerase [Sphingomonadaceae bacterium]|nr:phosphoribosylanthranilate isomerase [Sphingomonadaceae bacterium]
MPLKVKICGLSTPETVDAAVRHGAFALGFVFHGKSPRNVSIEQAAALMERVPMDRVCVGVFVDPDDEQINAVRRRCRMGGIQFHGVETPERLAQLKQGAAAGLQTIKAIPVKSANDVLAARGYARIATMVLFDAKTPPGAKLPGGMGLRFDWTLIREHHNWIPFGVSGGLDAGNVHEAIQVTRTDFVDVSSGVESAPGVKDVDKIAGFLQAAHAR